MNRRLRFIVIVLAVSPLAFLLWELLVKQPYVAALHAVAGVFWPGGAASDRIAVPDSVANIVPFIILMVATPIAPIVNRVRRICYGASIIFAVQMGAVFFTSYWVSHPSPSNTGYFLSLMSSAIMMAIPCVAWLMLAWGPIQTLLPKTRPG